MTKSVLKMLKKCKQCYYNNKNMKNRYWMSAQKLHYVMTVKWWKALLGPVIPSDCQRRPSVRAWLVTDGPPIRPSSAARDKWHNRETNELRKHGATQTNETRETRATNGGSTDISCFPLSPRCNSTRVFDEQLKSVAPSRNNKLGRGRAA